MISFEPSHLSGEELKYELALRGMRNNGKENVRTRTSNLRKALQIEASQGLTSSQIGTSPYNIDTDLAACETTISEITHLLANTPYNKDSIDPFISRLAHVVARLQRIPLFPDSNGTRLSTKIAEAERLLSDLHDLKANPRKRPYTKSTGAIPKNDGSNSQEIQAFARTTQTQRSPLNIASIMSTSEQPPIVPTMSHEDNANRSYPPVVTNHMPLFYTSLHTPIINDFHPSNLGAFPRNPVTDPEHSTYSPAIHSSYFNSTANMSNLLPASRTINATNEQQNNTLRNIMPSRSIIPTTTPPAYVTTIPYENEPRLNPNWFSPIRSQVESNIASSGHEIHSNVPNLQAGVHPIGLNNQVINTNPPIMTNQLTYEEFISTKTRMESEIANLIANFQKFVTQTTTAMGYNVTQTSNTYINPTSGFNTLTVQASSNSLPNPQKAPTIPYHMGQTAYGNFQPQPQNISINPNGNLPYGQHPNILNSNCSIPMANYQNISHNPQQYVPTTQPIWMADQTQYTNLGANPMFGHQPIPNNVPSVPQQSVLKATPIDKWRITFSNDTPLKENEYGLHEWIEKVQMFARSNQVSLDEVAMRVVNLLSGSALRWYPEVQSSVNGWNDLVAKMRNKFMTQNSQYEMLQTLDRRTQQGNESVMSFITNMRAIFRALPMPEPEIRLVYTIRRNLKREITRGFTHESCETMDQLEKYARNAEMNMVTEPRARTFTTRNYRYVNEMEATPESPSEPDDENVSESEHNGDDFDENEIFEMMKKFVKSKFQSKDRNRPASSRSRNTQKSSSTGGANYSPSRMKVDVKNRNAEKPGTDYTCFNCLEKGHKLSQCKKPITRIFCFRCGLEEAMANDCPSCKEEKNE